MLSTSRKLAAAALLFSAMLAAACSDDDPAGPGLVPPLGLSVTATGSSTAEVTFAGRPDDDGYVIERAEGAAGGTFAEVGTVPKPASAGTITFEDDGLDVQTTYRYRAAAR